MEDNKHILVPISVQVLVNKGDLISSIDLRSRFDPDNNTLGEDFQYNLAIAEDDIFTMKEGVHLHWQLPKLLKHGITNEEGETEFPAVPNRWMIVRVQTNGDDNEEMASKIWVLKSDVIEKNDDDRENNWTELVYSPDKQEYAFSKIGVAQEYDSDYDDSTTDEVVSLQAVGIANPYFSSIYGECQYVFGFHDDMKDVKDAMVFNYTIVGWYANQEDNPLSPKNQEKALFQKIKKLWKYSNSNAAIEGSIYHTSVHNVVWKDLGTGVPKGNVNLVIGNTSVEALSARIAKDNEGHPIDEEVINKNKELYLNALQYDLLKDETKIHTTYSLELENHQRQFSPRYRGFMWELLKKENNEASIESQESKKFFPEDNNLITTLKSLNKEQLEYNQNISKLQSLQQDYYFAWYKKEWLTNKESVVLDKNEKDKHLKILDQNSKNLLQKINALKETINVAQLSIANQIITINDAYNDIEILVLDKIQKSHSSISIPKNKIEKPDASYQLVQRAEERYWEPHDPVVLLSGSGLGEVASSFLGLQDVVSCRTTSEINKELSIVIDNENTNVANNVFKVPLDAIDNNSIPSQIIKNLVYESLLLDANLASWLAVKAFAQLGSPKGKESPIVKNLVNNEIIPKQKGKIDSNLFLPDSYAIQEHTQAWRPTFLLWELEYNLTNHPSKKITCRGLSPLTDSIIKRMEDIGLHKTAAKYNNVVMQTLSGFNKHLLAQVPSLQLPPRKISENTSDFVIDTELLKRIDNNARTYSVGCKPEQEVFSPVRHGELKIMKLSVIDGFGQQKKVMFEQNMLLSNSLKAKPNDSNKILLEKRIIQPARIKFDWLNAASEILFQDTGKLDHPIIGWLVPNYLEDRLMVYGQDGNEVQILPLNKVGDYIPESTRKTKIRDEDLINERKQHTNETLRTIIGNVSTKLTEILQISKKIKDKLYEANIKIDNNAVSLLYGQPIAIAKARVTLELLGKPYDNPIWNEDAVDNAIEAVKLMIGDNKQNNDGIIGYYLDNDYENLYLRDNKVFPQLNTDGLEITLLMNSGTGFYLNTDNVLPTKYINLYPQATKELTENINISFMIAPFIANRKAPNVPTPETMNINWKWMHKTDVNTWQPPKKTDGADASETLDIQPQQIYEGWVKMDKINRN